MHSCRQGPCCLDLPGYRLRNRPFGSAPIAAAMAELADALGSGPSDRKIVEVRLLLAAVTPPSDMRELLADFGKISLQKTAVP